MFLMGCFSVIEKGIVFNSSVWQQLDGFFLYLIFFSQISTLGLPKQLQAYLPEVAWIITILHIHIFFILFYLEPPSNGLSTDLRDLAASLYKKSAFIN